MGKTIKPAEFYPECRVTFRTKGVRLPSYKMPTGDCFAVASDEEHSENTTVSVNWDPNVNPADVGHRQVYRKEELYCLDRELIRALNELRLSRIEIENDDTISINARIYNRVMDILSMCLGEPFKGANYNP